MPSDFTTLTCPSCGAKTRLDNFTERLVCEYCGNEHILGAEKRPALRPEIPQPANVLVENDRQVARLIQRWFSLKYIPMAFFAIAWDSFLFFWYSMAFGSGMPWIMAVFPLLHVAVGIGVTYSTIAGFINRTVLEVSRDEIGVWFEPLPWLGEKTLKTREVKQFYCKEKVVHSKNGTQTQYELYAVTASNQQVKLLGNLENPDAALFFEQQLERWLKIADRPVAGEINW
jgi:DNA-directed RNA polymerase subunit RPC12/RpoP